MTRSVRLGVLVPSSNTAVEPLTQAIISSITLTGITLTAHFSRFSVTEISQSKAALSQFDLKHILAAAQLLADAKVDVIGWSGTSAGWIQHGFNKDEDMCRAIQEAFGIPATSSTLALNALLQNFNVKKLGLVTPYLASMNEAIIRNYATIGVDIAHERHLDMTDNVSIGDVTEKVLDDMVDAVVANGVTAITTFCTNLHAAHLVPRWESKYPNLIFFDTVSTVVWSMLNMVSIETGNVKGWGKMFETTKRSPSDIHV
jgi:maleate isomerase